MDVDDIKELIRVLDESDLVELTWEHKEQRLVLRKASAVSAPPAAPMGGAVQPPAGLAVAVGTGSQIAGGQGAPPLPAAAAAGPGATATTGAGSDAETPSGDRDDGRFTSVVSPMVGTFYRAPAPDEPPYVQVGDRVEVGQPLCIIEAMKLMNEIESEVSGWVREILVENGQPVQYGQVLFIIERD